MEDGFFPVLHLRLTELQGGDPGYDWWSSLRLLSAFYFQVGLRQEKHWHPLWLQNGVPHGLASKFSDLVNMLPSTAMGLFSWLNLGPKNWRPSVDCMDEPDLTLWVLRDVASRSNDEAERTREAESQGGAIPGLLTSNEDAREQLSI